MSDGQLLLLADLVLAIHFCITVYIVLGLPIIWIGRFFDWRFVRNPWFRYSHVGLMGVVFLESMVGIFCPLTTLEGTLRRAAGQERAGDGISFIGYWMGQLLFYDIDETIFTIAYGLFLMAVIGTLWLVPIRKR